MGKNKIIPEVKFSLIDRKPTQVQLAAGKRFFDSLFAGANAKQTLASSAEKETSGHVREQGLRSPQKPHNPGGDTPHLLTGGSQTPYDEQ